MTAHLVVCSLNPCSYSLKSIESVMKMLHSFGSTLQPLARAMADGAGAGRAPLQRSWVLSCGPRPRVDLGQSFDDEESYAMGYKVEDGRWDESEEGRTSEVKLSEKQGWMKNDTPSNRDRRFWPAPVRGSGGGVAAIFRAHVRQKV